jgi:hypothetical protein
MSRTTFTRFSRKKTKKLDGIYSRKLSIVGPKPERSVNAGKLCALLFAITNNTIAKTSVSVASITMRRATTQCLRSSLGKLDLDTTRTTLLGLVKTITRKSSYKDTLALTRSIGWGVALELYG